MEVKVKKGVIKLNLPNYIESWRMRSFVGIPDQGYEYAAWSTARLAEYVSENPHLIDMTDAEGFNSFTEFMDDPENSPYVTIVLSKFAVRMMEFSEAKKN